MLLGLVYRIRRTGSSSFLAGRGRSCAGLFSFPSTASLQPSLHLLYAAPAFRIRYGTNKKIGTAFLGFFFNNHTHRHDAIGIDRKIIRTIHSRQRRASPFPSSRLKKDRSDVDTSRSGDRKTGLAALGSQALQHRHGHGAAPPPPVRQCGELVRELGTDGPCINKCAGTWAEPRRGLARARAVSGSGW